MNILLSKYVIRLFGIYFADIYNIGLINFAFSMHHLNLSNGIAFEGSKDGLLPKQQTNRLIYLETSHTSLLLS